MSQQVDELQVIAGFVQAAPATIEIKPRQINDSCPIAHTAKLVMPQKWSRQQRRDRCRALFRGPQSLLIKVKSIVQERDNKRITNAHLKKKERKRSGGRKEKKGAAA